MSEMLATVLLTGMTVALAGGFAYVVFSTVTDESEPPRGELALTASPGARNATFTYVTGTSLALADADFVLSVDGSIARLSPAAVSTAVAGRLSAGDIYRLDLSIDQPTLGAGSVVDLMVVAREAGGTVGRATFQVASPASLPAYRSALPAVSAVRFDPGAIVADAATTTTLSARVSSPYGLRFVSSVTANLTSLEGPVAFPLRDDGRNGDLVAGDGNYSAPITVPISALQGGLGRSLAITVTATDVFGNVIRSPQGGVLAITPATPPLASREKVVPGAGFLDLPASSAAGTIFFTNFTFVDKAKLDDDEIEFRISDSTDPTRSWFTNVFFKDCGPTGAGVSSLRMSRDGVTTDLTYTPPGGCFSIDLTSKIDVINPDRSRNHLNQTSTWSIAGNTNLRYTAVGVGSANVGSITWFGETDKTHTNRLTGLGQADIQWGLVPTAQFTIHVNAQDVQVDASASSSPDSPITSYTWDWGDGTPLGTGVLANHTYAGSGNKTIKLTITTGAGATDSLQQNLTLSSGAPTARFTNTTNLLQLNVDASTSTDPESDPLTYAWQWGDGSSAGNSSSPTAVKTYATAGNYTVNLTVWDSGGLSSTASHVVRVNRPPTAGFAQTANAGLTATFSSSASDPDGDSISHRWSWGDGTNTTGTATPSKTYAAAGSYTVNLTVTDARGANASTTLLVTVTGKTWFSCSAIQGSISNCAQAGNDADSGASADLGESGNPRSLEIRFTGAGLPEPGRAHTLHVRLRMDANPENVYVNLTSDGGTTWQAGAIAPSTTSGFALYTVSMTDAQWNNGAPLVRIVDFTRLFGGSDGGTPSGWSLDYIMVVSS